MGGGENEKIISLGANSFHLKQIPFLKRHNMWEKIGSHKSCLEKENLPSKSIHFKNRSNASLISSRKKGLSVY